jgi:hypothetical protein
MIQMLNRYQKEFEEFARIHDRYKTEGEKWKSKFDEIGRPVVRIIEETENRLCSKMEGSGRGQYSSNLSEKFRQEVRKRFPLIDLVGVKIS